jgi:hypothetical protein
MRNKKKYINILLHLFLFLLAVLIVLPMFSVSWPATHDMFRYPALSYAFKDAFSHGVYFPRWLPDLCGGYGYPSFVFYQPGLFYLVLFVQFFGASIFLAYKIIFLFLFYLSFLGVYKLSGEFTKDTPTRIFAVALFALTPYLYVDFYVRGDLSELASILITPWPLYFFIKATKGNNVLRVVIYTFMTSLCLAAMVYTHPLPCVFYFPMFCVFALGMCYKEERLQIISILKIVVISLISAVILSAPYWLNAYFMKQFVHAERALTGYYLPKYHFVYPSQLFSNFWGFGASLSGLNDGMSFQLGLVHFTLASIGAFFAYKNKRILIIYIFYFFLIMMMTPVSYFLWQAIPVIAMLQFPWRLLSVIAIMQVICSMGIIEWKIKKLYLYAIYAVLILFSLYWYHEQFKVKSISEIEVNKFPQYTEFARNYFITATAEKEFLPITATGIEKARGDAPLLQVSHTACKVTPDTNSNKYHLKYTVSTAKAVNLRINQYYFPGWRIFVSGKRINDDEIINDLPDSGLMQLSLNSGSNHTIEAYYDGPVGWRYVCGFAIFPVIIFCIFIGVYLIREKIKRNN